MGTCSTKSDLTPEQKEALKKEQQASKGIDKVISSDMKEQERVIKILLLGAGESGKSTLFKQMITLYGKGFSDEERKQYIPVVYENIITQAKILVKQTDALEEIIHDTVLTNADSIEARKLIDELKNEDVVDDVVAESIDILWKDPRIQRVYEHRAMYQLNDSVQYYFDKVFEVAKKSFVPSDQDIVRSRVRTTGIVENEFIIDGNPFKMFDVGGQRNERKKWIHCFEGVTTLFFVAAISEYDQKLYEDKKTNRIEEALNLFDETVNSPYFTKTPIILFLNKRDLFEKKIKSVPLTVCFPNYKGSQEYKECVEYMTQQFLERCRFENKAVYCHVTCATDTGNVKFVFEAVKDIIINRNLDTNGLN